jgi:hypothetical protein
MRGLDPRIHLLVKKDGFRNHCRVLSFIHSSQEIPMTLTVAHVTPLVALIAGILILLVPRLLNYVVAIYLIIVGITGLNGIYHFFR